MTLTFGSLFSGIGGIDLGLERAGMTCSWQVEIDEYATQVLAKHWPHVTRFRDVRDCGARNLSTVDVLAGGFPCQDISGAGRRAGITGERSGLWTEFARIVRELQPRYVLVENVAALLYPLRRNGTIEPAPIGRVLGDLASCGYDAQWQIISATAVGAPHLRERVFIVAYLPHATGNRCQWRQHQSQSRQYERTPFAGENGNGQQVAHTTSNGRRSRGSECQGQQREILTERSSASLLADACSAGCQEFDASTIANRQGYITWRSPAPGNVSDATGRRERQYIFPRSSQETQSLTFQSSWWAVEPELGRVAHGIPARVDRLRGLGNAVVPQVAEFVGRLIVEQCAQQEVEVS